MKKIIISFFALFFSVLGMTQETAAMVPENIKTAFTLKYPKALEVEWKVKDSLYKVEFEQNELDISISFDLNGNTKKIKEEIQVDSLPQVIKDYVKTKLKDKKITEATKKVNEKGIVSYKIEIGKNEYTFDDKGNFIP